MTFLLPKISHEKQDCWSSKEEVETWASALFEMVEEGVCFTEATPVKNNCLKEKAQITKMGKCPALQLG